MKHMKLKRGAFTLIELLVVITIIGILAGIALPVYGSIQERGSQTKALTQAKQIGLALKLYATDNDGLFPNLDTPAADGSKLPAIDNANIAFRPLVPAYVSSENIFFVGKSKWSTKKPDEDNATAAKILEQGENHWAYVTGLSEISNSQLPLVADGFSASTVGTYSTSVEEKGGLWKGKKAIVVRVDQSGALETCVVTGTTSIVKGIVGATGGATQNIFTYTGTSWLTATQVAKNPL